MYTHILILPDGSELSSGPEETCAIRSVRLTSAICRGSELTLGGAVPAELTVRLLGSAPGLQPGDQVVLLRNMDGARSRAGVFIVQSLRHTAPGAVTLTAYDRLALLEQDLTGWLASLTGWPYTLHAFASMVCARCGVTLADSTIPNGSISVNAFTAGTVTGLELLRLCAEASGSFARADEQGDIRFCGCEDAIICVGGGGERFCYGGSMASESYTVSPVDLVRLRRSDGLWPDAPDGANAFIITNNPILSQLTDTAPLDVIAGRIPHGYTPAVFGMPLDPAVTPGSILTVVDALGRGLRVLVMELESEGSRMRITCRGSARRDGFTAVRHLTAAQSAALQQLYAQLAAQNALQSLTSEQVFDRLTDGGAVQGFYTYDGKLYINAEYVQILNLVASAFRAVSESGDTVMELDAADGQPDIRLYESYDGSTVRRHQAVMTPDAVRLTAADETGLPTGAAALQLENGLGCVYADTLYPSGAGNCKWEYIESLGKTVLVQQ